MLKNRKKQKYISVDDTLTQLDESDIDLSGTDNEYGDVYIEYVSEPAKLSSEPELRSSDTDEADSVPNTSSP